MSQNNKTAGRVEFVVYYDFVEQHYVGVCLTFNIVIEGNDPTLLEHELRQAAELHIETVREHGLSDELLNRHAPKEYWDIYYANQQQQAVGAGNTQQTNIERDTNPMLLSTPYSASRGLVVA